MLLTDEEISATSYEHFAEVAHVHDNDMDWDKWANDFARAIEAAILAKLASAELPEPDCFLSTNRYGNSPDAYPIYTADQLCQAYAQGAAAQLTEKPSAWKWKVNRFHQHLEDYCPPDDAYDEGTLIELYTRRQA